MNHNHHLTAVGGEAPRVRKKLRPKGLDMIAVDRPPEAPERAPARGRSARLKRAIDVVLAGAGLVIAAPVIAAAALLVRLTSRGPGFYSQTRSGMGGRPFRI